MCLKLNLLLKTLDFLVGYCKIQSNGYLARSFSKSGRKEGYE